MNITVFAAGDDVFTNCECIHGYAFKKVAPRGKSVYITHDFATLRDKFTLLTATSAQSQDKSVYSTVLNASRHIHTS